LQRDDEGVLDRMLELIKEDEADMAAYDSYSDDLNFERDKK
jgi:hypothetical protein